MSIFITRVCCQTHDAELLTSATLERIKLVELIERSIEEMFLCFSRSHHESRVRHICINLLDNQVFRSLALILVGTLAQHLILPRLFALQVFSIPQPDILHNEIDRPVHAALTRSGTRKQQRHQSRLVLHVVNIPEPRLPEMRSQRREDSVRHSRLINFRRPRYQQLHQLRQFLRHLRRVRIILISPITC